MEDESLVLLPPARCHLGNNMAASITIKWFTKNLLNRGIRKPCLFCNIHSKVFKYRDPEPLFFSWKMQELLNKMTGLSLRKVYKPLKTEIKEPTYQFVTTEELEKLEEEAKVRAKQKLQMPPVLKERETIDEVLSQDPELIAFEQHKLIFTDITYGISNRDRLIVVRDINGVLRKASWEERDRMNQLYFPFPSRKLEIPKMFEAVQLQEALDDGKYEFLLDRACAQFEPDDPFYIEITHKVYDHVNYKKAFQVLHSTRHFGPMVFYLAYFKNIDSLLVHLIKLENLDDAVNLIKVYHIIHPDCQSAVKCAEISDPLTLIRTFATLDSLKYNNIELALQTIEELQQQRQQVTDGISHIHSLS